MSAALGSFASSSSRCFSRSSAAPPPLLRLCCFGFASFLVTSPVSLPLLVTLSATVTARGEPACRRRQTCTHPRLFAPSRWQARYHPHAHTSQPAGSSCTKHRRPRERASSLPACGRAENVPSQQRRQARERRKKKGRRDAAGSFVTHAASIFVFFSFFLY